MELKTLKDFEREDKIIDMKTFRTKRYDTIIYKSELKAEAIKWVEFLETPPVSFEDEKTIEWIKCFFNIEMKGGIIDNE